MRAARFRARTCTPVEGGEALDDHRAAALGAVKDGDEEHRSIAPGGSRGRSPERLALWLIAGVPVLSVAALNPAPWSFVLAGAFVIVALALAVKRRKARARREVRTLLVGSAASLDALAHELDFNEVDRYLLVGRLEPRADLPLDPSALGRVENLREVAIAHDVALVLMTPEVSRMTVFDEMAFSCDDLPLRLWDLSGFYEDTFRYTPMADINAAWFQYILHPRFRATQPIGKRGFDLAFALLSGLCFLPLLAILVPLIRRDGGSALFRQTRIGQGGRPFTIYKLRTMSESSDATPRWASADDPRITPLGRWLRASHLDELPQLWNILCGDMSVIGPRPEQPAFVAQLEREFPFYHRRHQIRPGLAGWAQSRCGYAGSRDGTAWKLCHDLYYVKHSSLLGDALILFETLLETFRDAHRALRSPSERFVLGEEARG